MTARRTIGTVLAAAALTGLAACASGTTIHTTAPTPTKPAAIHNPVDILRRATGCVIPVGEVLGQPTLFNDGGLGYYASCTYGANSATQTNEQLEVWRYPSHAVMLQGNGDGPSRRDGMTFIMSNDDGDWFAEVTAGDSGLASGPPPAAIAASIGGVIS